LGPGRGDGWAGPARRLGLRAEPFGPRRIRFILGRRRLPRRSDAGPV